MAKEYFFKKDFWTGFYKLTQRTKISPGQGIVGYLMLFGAVFLLIGIGLMALPFVLVILCYGINRKYRLWGGIAIVLSMIYFYLDIIFKWLTPYFFYGYTDDLNQENNAMFGLSGLYFFLMLNLFSTAFGIYFILDSLLYRTKRQYFQEVSNIFLVSTAVIGLVFSTKLTNLFMQTTNVEIYEVINKVDEVRPQKESIIHKIDEIPTSNEISPSVDSLPIPSTAYYAMYGDDDTFHSEAIVGFLNSLTHHTMKATDYFAYNIEKFDKLKNIHPLEIDELYQKDSSDIAGYKFKFDVNSIVFVNEKNGVLYYELWIENRSYLKSTKRTQHSKKLLKYGVNDEGKLTFFAYPQIKFDRFY